METQELNQVAVDYLKRTSQHTFKIKRLNNKSTIFKVVAVDNDFYEIILEHDAESNICRLVEINSLKRCIESKEHHSHLGNQKHFVDTVVTQQLFNKYTSVKQVAIKSNWKTKMPFKTSEIDMSLHGMFSEIRNWIKNNHNLIEEYTNEPKYLWTFKSKVDLTGLFVNGLNKILFGYNVK